MRPAEAEDSLTRRLTRLDGRDFLLRVSVPGKMVHFCLSQGNWLASKEWKRSPIRNCTNVASSDQGQRRCRFHGSDMQGNPAWRLCPISARETCHSSAVAVCGLMRKSKLDASVCRLVGTDAGCANRPGHFGRSDVDQAEARSPPFSLIVYAQPRQHSGAVSTPKRLAE
jgi:hypothetical protein